MKYETPPNQSEILNAVKSQLSKHGVDFDLSEITSSVRRQHLVFKRALVCHCLHKMGLSTAYIGSIINRDHSTVLWNLKYRSQNPNLKMLYEKVTTEMNTNGSLGKFFTEEKIKFHENEIEKLKTANSMETFKVEKAVPLPNRFRYPFAEMNVGDSFWVEANEGRTKSLRQILMNNASAFCKKTSSDNRFATKVENNGVRIWRVK